MNKILYKDLKKNLLQRNFLYIINGYEKVLSSPVSLYKGKKSFIFPVTETCEITQHGGKAVFETEILPVNKPKKILVFLGIEFSSDNSFPQVTGSFNLTVNNDFSLDFCSQHHSCVWKSKDITINFFCEYSYFPTIKEFMLTDTCEVSQGLLCISLLGSRIPTDKPLIIEITGKCTGESERVLRVFKARGIPNYLDLAKYLQFNNIDVRGQKILDSRVFFGDIHNHSQEQKDSNDGGCGIGRIEDNYLYARDLSRLDFYALTEHDYQIKDSEGWRQWQYYSAKYNEDGKFVCFPAFEWTHRTIGHRNIYYKTEGGPFFTSRIEGQTLNQENNLETVWEQLRNSKVPAFSVPHHPASAEWPFDWTTFNPSFDRLVEIYSSWGSGEHYGNDLAGFGTQHINGLSIRDALRNRLKFGIIASSDSHDGHPGNSQSPEIKHHHLYHLNGSGRVGVLCESFNRESIFNALYNRRCFATSGQPMMIDFFLNDTPMGGEIKIANKETRLYGMIKGSMPLNNCDVIFNGKIIKRFFLDEYEFKFDELLTVPDTKSSFIYLRSTQSDNGVLWSSPIFVEKL